MKKPPKYYIMIENPLRIVMLTPTLTFQALSQTYLPTLKDDLFHIITTADLPKILDEACRYSIDAGGKRLRPLLVMAGFLAVGGVGDIDMARRSAVAVELLHSYSLIHDDLPCMDDDELRRGKPTCHIVFGEGVALLAGDALQSLAFESLTMDTPAFSPADLQLSGQLSQIFASRARRMVAGQMKDVLGENQTLNQNELESIHKDKTGALIEASLLMGAVCGKATTETLTTIKDYAKTLGLAFQVQDDILDVTADTATLGKPAGSDEKLAKSTYVKLLGLDGAKTYNAELFATAKEQATTLPNPAILLEIVNWVQNRHH